MTTPTFKLNTGAGIPAVGFGTYGDVPEKAYKMVWDALEAGYTHIDLSPVYKNLKECGDAINDWLAQNKGKVSRSDLFIVSKVWRTQVHNVEAALNDDLTTLRLDYVDLFLMHWPFSMISAPDDPYGFKGEKKDESGWTFVDTWKDMEKLPKSKTRAIGVSNFTSVKLKKLLEHATTVPAVNQVEMHYLLAQNKLLDLCKEHGIIVEAYAPLARGLVRPVIAEIAAKHQCDTGQVVLSWNVQRGVVVLPKSSTPSRIQSNLQLVTLDEEQMAQINNIGEVKRLIDPSSRLDIDIFDGGIDE